MIARKLAALMLAGAALMFLPTYWAVVGGIVLVAGMAAFVGLGDEVFKVPASGEAPTESPSNSPDAGRSTTATRKG